jgi:hypothetical protein
MPNLKFTKHAPPAKSQVHKACATRRGPWSDQQWTPMRRQRRRPTALTMEHGVHGTDWKRIPISIATFIGHQFASTFGVAFFASLLGISFHDVWSKLGAKYTMRPVYFILTETPYFPVQITLGLWFGWLLRRRFGHRSMNYVWVLPSLLLCSAILLFWARNDAYASVFADKPSLWSHYFGWGCQPKNRCLDQLFFTMPLYAATSYSIGSWFASRVSARRR